MSLEQLHLFSVELLWVTRVGLEHLSVVLSSELLHFYVLIQKVTYFLHMEESGLKKK